MAYQLARKVLHDFIAPEEKPGVALSNILLVYPQNNTVALKGVSLDVFAGSHLAVMGPSGSGKTSLLRCISGRLKPTSGRVVCNGSVATIHQDLRLVAQRSALENVLHGAMGRHSLLKTLLWFPKAERVRAKKLLCRVGLCEKVHMPVKFLSGGEQQRVAIARALMQDPTVLLADEPVASLDEDTAFEIMDLIQELARERDLTVVSVLHDYRIARKYADQIVRLRNGKVIYTKSTKEAPFVDQSVSLEHGEEEREPAIERRSIRDVPKRDIRWGTVGIFSIGLIACIWAIAGLNIGSRELDGVFGGLIDFVRRLVPASPQELREIPWGVLFGALVETLQMAVIGTVFGILLSWPLAALAAKNIGPRRIRPIVRFLLNGIRTVPSLIWALLFVAAVGLGTLAGVLALIAYSIGYLTKFFYESFESVDPGPPDALQEIGASGLQRFLHAVWPAAKPAVLSSGFFMLEYNVRAASILGIVDAGGIGFYIKQYIDYRAFPVVTVSLLMILGVVVLFDAVSGLVRKKLLHS